jgi:hypothetical protein
MNGHMKGLLIVVFAICTLVLNVTIIDEMVMPDPCYYHNHEMGILLGLFYSSSSASGGHPEINLFNVLFTLSTGGFMGFLVYSFLGKKSD